jgi:TRAP-type C4-dicarboxylate transport system substrate-binding protein
MWFSDEVTKRTNGLIKFKHVWAFALTKPGEEIDAINTGLSQAAFFPAVYYPARLFLYNFDHSVFGGSPDLKRAIEWADPFLYGGAPMLQKEIEKEGMKFLFAEIAPSWELETRMPITKLDDLQGKKIAVAGVYAQAHVAASGAVALSPTMTDRGSMLQTGALDGSILPRNVSFPFKLYEFAKYNMPVLWGCWLTSIGVIDVKLFNSYPKDIQQILLNLGREATRYLSKLEVPHQEKMEKIMKSAGVTFNPPLSKQDRMRWIEQGGEPIAKWLEEAEKRGVGPEGKELMRTYFRLQEQKVGHEWPDRLKRQLK